MRASNPFLEKVISVSTIAAFFGLLPAPEASGASPGEAIDRYDLVWTSPGRDPSGSMPLGNGEVGLNLWVEEGGDLLFIISRTDAWSEACRLLKLGRLRISLSPNPFTKGAPFRQELKLREGCVEIAAGEPGKEARLKVFVDPSSPVVHVALESEVPREVRAALEAWRTSRKRLQGEELRSSWTMQDAPAGIEVWESADVMAEGSRGAILWYHRNESSIVPLTLKHQGLEDFSGLVTDPLLHRTFGGLLAGQGLLRDGQAALRSPAPLRRASVRVATHSARTESAASWKEDLEAIDRSSEDPAAAAGRCASWWKAFWDRSWVLADGDGASALPGNSLPLRIGADSNGGNRFAGLLGRASLFDRPLDGAEIAKLASGRPDEALSPSPHLLASLTFSGGKAAAFRGAAGEGLEARPAKELEMAAEGGIAAVRLGTGHLEVPADPRLDFPRGFTLEAWIRIGEGAGPGRIFDKITAGGSDGFLLDTHPGRDLRLIAGDRTLSAGSVLASGKWQHVAASFDPASGSGRLFVDGKPAGGGSPRMHDDPAPPSRVTQAWILQRWIAACGGRGSYPIKFNGSIFTVDPEFTGGPKLNADWRRWGDCYWWQNTRFPYFAMLPSGDFDHMAPLFRMYREVLPICKARARSYHGAEGAYFPETMTIFGTYSNNDYGWNREGRKPSEVLCPYWCYAWQQGLELVALMEDYLDYTGDGRFLVEELIPMAREVLRYYDTRFPRDDRGKLAIRPTQAVETYWHGVTNDTPSVAGLQAVLGRLLELPEGAAPAEDRNLWRRLKAAAPAVPVGTDGGKSFILPAEKFDPRRSNIENPELYSIWPFRLYGVGRPGLETGIETWRRRVQKTAEGWSYDGQCAAILGLAEDARRQILSKVRNSNPGHRFPAMWGPNYDWLPDQDHGSNILLTIEHMLLFPVGEKIHLLPAWPADWDVRFKLHAPRRTTVECEFRGGKVVDLKVEPPGRKADVVLPENLGKRL